MTTPVNPASAHQSTAPNASRAAAQRRPLKGLLAKLGALLAALLLAFPASAAIGNVQTAWQLLDYIAVDYAGAVKDGGVISQTEFAEMNEFSGTVAKKLAALPAKPGRPHLVADAKQLKSLIAGKATPQDVARLAHRIAADLLKAYPVPLAPQSAPDMAKGTQLFVQNCASCHGVSGNGEGPDAAKLATPPVAFTDRERARQRSLFALQQVISNGIDGTAMQSFSSLSAADRWDLAFKSGSFAFPKSLAPQGKEIWNSSPTVRKQIPDLEALVEMTPQSLAATIGPAKADAVMAYLRRHPEIVMAPARGATSLDLSRSKLTQSLQAYRSGDRDGAKTLALAAYLDGFEPIEPVLGARDATLLRHIERNMGEYRAAIDQGAPVDMIATQVAVLNALFDDADQALSSNATSGTTTFIGAFTVLLREGLEALLIVVAMIAFLDKAERRNTLRYVHAGWAGALIAGGVTWVVATYAIGISGASRELTEGFGSIIAAIVLLSVGIWMHGKSQAGEWQRYIHERLSQALNKRSGWFLFGLAFLVVYREVFETILFYAALWAQGSGAAMLAGAGAAALLLGAMAWFMLRYSRKMPIATFFKYSSWLMAVLTIVLIGKGVAALQEAGLIDIMPLAGAPRLSMIGVFPTTQSMGAQALMLLAILAGFALNRRRKIHISTEENGLN